MAPTKLWTIKHDESHVYQRNIPPLDKWYPKSYIKTRSGNRERVEGVRSKLNWYGKAETVKK